jgi:predicted amidohydrolase
VLETDFGRIGVRICADNAHVEIDRSYGVKGVDILFDLTQDWGPDAIHRNLRNITRAMDAQMFRVEATHSSSEVLHRSHVVEPTGILVAQSQYMSNGLVSAVIDLDNDRPRRFTRQWRGPPARRLPASVPVHRNAADGKRPERDDPQALAPPGAVPSAGGSTAPAATWFTRFR